MTEQSDKVTPIDIEISVPVYFASPDAWSFIAVRAADRAALGVREKEKSDLVFIEIIAIEPIIDKSELYYRQLELVAEPVQPVPRRDNVQITRRTVSALRRRKRAWSRTRSTRVAIRATCAGAARLEHHVRKHDKPAAVGARNGTAVSFQKLAS